MFRPVGQLFQTIWRQINLILPWGRHSNARQRSAICFIPRRRENGKIALTHCQKVNKFPTLDAIDRQNVKVIVNPGGTNQSFVDANIKQAQIIRTKDNVANLQGIRNKSADIMFTDLIEGDYYQSKEPGVFCVATPEVLAGTGSYKVYMMAKDNQPLLEEVNQWLAGKTKTLLAQKWNISE